MTDSLTKKHRSWNMSRIRSKNTKPEIMVRSHLHRLGFRFTLRYKGLPCRPDIVLPKYKTVIFVHGCFWHRHKGCPDTSTPKTRTAFWNKKFQANVRRDRRNVSQLRRAGWQVIIIWACQVLQSREIFATRLGQKLRSGSSSTPARLTIRPNP